MLLTQTEKALFLVITACCIVLVSYSLLTSSVPLYSVARSRLVPVDLRLLLVGNKLYRATMGGFIRVRRKAKGHDHPLFVVAEPGAPSGSDVLEDSANYLVPVRARWSAVVNASLQTIYDYYTPAERRLLSNPRYAFRLNPQEFRRCFQRVAADPEESVQFTASGSQAVL